MRAELIAAAIRRTLKVHRRTGRQAIRLPDADALIVAELLEHYAAWGREPRWQEIYDRRAVMWREACAHVGGLLSVSERDATHLVEEASDALTIIPAWRVIRADGPRYLSFTGPQVRQIARCATRLHNERKADIIALISARSPPAAGGRRRRFRRSGSRPHRRHSACCRPERPRQRRARPRQRTPRRCRACPRPRAATRWRPG